MVRNVATKKSSHYNYGGWVPTVLIAPSPQIIQQVSLKEQLPEEYQQRDSMTSMTSATSKTTAAMRKKQEEKILFQSLQIPNPYSLVGR